MLDSATGLYYFNARFYDPSIARFTTKDPGGSDASSPYLYANDNPLGYVDPTGLQAMSPFCPECEIHGSQTFAQAYSWYREYEFSQDAIRQACLGGDRSACNELTLTFASGLVGGPAGDFAEPAFRIPLTIDWDTVKSYLKSVGYHRGIPSASASNVEKGEFGRALGEAMMRDLGLEHLAVEWRVSTNFVTEEGNSVLMIERADVINGLRNVILEAKTRFTTSLGGDFSVNQLNGFVAWRNDLQGRHVYYLIVGVGRWAPISDTFTALLEANHVPWIDVFIPRG
jgi:hypothetical protein